MTIPFPTLLLFLNPVSLYIRTEQLQTKQAGREIKHGREKIQQHEQEQILVGIWEQLQSLTWPTLAITIQSELLTRE